MFVAQIKQLESENSEQKITNLGL